MAEVVESALSAVPLVYPINQNSS